VFIHSIPNVFMVKACADVNSHFVAWPKHKFRFASLLLASMHIATALCHSVCDYEVWGVRGNVAQFQNREHISHIPYFLVFVE
jgi:hypothetical protein